MKENHHFDMLMIQLACPGCQSDLTAAGAVLIGRISRGDDAAPLIPVARTRVVPLDNHSGLGLVEDTVTLNACEADGRYTCVFCRRGIEDLGLELVWKDRREFESQLDDAAKLAASRRQMASDLLLEVLLRLTSSLRLDHGRDAELAGLRDMFGMLTSLVGVPAECQPHEDDVPDDGEGAADALRWRCSRVWSRVPAARVAEVLEYDVMRRLGEGDAAEEYEGAFARVLRRSATEGLRALCRVLWTENPWYRCHVEGFLADARALGVAAEAAYLRLLARSLWAEMTPNRRPVVLGRCERLLGGNDRTIDRAKLLADFHGGRGEGAFQAGLYSDGVILYLTASRETEEFVRGNLADCIEEAVWSSDGFCAVLILRGEPEPLMDRAAEVADDLEEKLTYTDNRDKDANRIDLFVQMLRLGQWPENR